MAINRFRLLPDFLIIGAQKSGTTSLHHYLYPHPDIRVADIKEVHFFDVQFHKGLNWYRGHFPTGLKRSYHQLSQRRKLLCGEGTPYYLFHPLAPQRIAKFLPTCKLIVLLKNPVGRALSHYQHERKRGFEPLPSFEAAIEAEPERLAQEADALITDPTHDSYPHMHYSYLSRGRYVEQLERWFDYFPREQFFIESAENLFQDPATVYQNITDFLGVPRYLPKDFGKHNSNRYRPLDPATRDRLTAYFEPYNERLYTLLNRRFNWD